MVGSNDSVTAGISRLCSEIPPTVQALTGVDLSKVSQD